MFAVVKTIEDGNSVFTTVPEKWIDFNNGMLYFPNSILDWKKMRSKMIKPSSSWDVFKCSVVERGFINLSDATDLEKKKINFLNTDDENVQILSKKNQRKHPANVLFLPNKDYNKSWKLNNDNEASSPSPIVASSSTFKRHDSASSQVDKNASSSIYKKEINSPPSSSLEERNSSSINAFELADDSDDNDEFLHHDNEENDSLLYRKNDSLLNRKNDSSQPPSFENEAANNNFPKNDPPSSKSRNENDPHLIEISVNFDGTVIIPTGSKLTIETQFALLREVNKIQFAAVHVKLDKCVNDMEKLMRAVHHGVDFHSDAVEEASEFGIEFPLKLPQDIDELEAKLNNQEFRIKLTSYFKQTIGAKGFPAKRVCYMLVDKMFAREVLVNYTWTGCSKKPNMKLNFSALRQINRIFYNVVKSVDANFSELEFENFFKNGVLKYSIVRANPKPIARQSTPRTVLARKKQAKFTAADDQENE